MRKSVYSVGQVNAYLKALIEEDYALRDISVRGELSGVKYHPSGHIYFTLKDSSGVLRGVMYAGSRRSLAFRLRDGMRVVASGRLSVYEQGGSYQLTAREITQDGVGLLYEELEKLKKKLSEQGLFDEQYKQPIPRYAFRVGVVTAASGAAIRDIEQIAARRNPYVQLYLFPAPVQGEGAAHKIAEAVGRADEAGMDVLIVGRGGGSIEDLWAFNEEEVAWAVFNARTPVISAVGHEIDFTICDLAADLRAPTPSAAAELAVFSLEEFRRRLDGLESGLKSGMARELEWEKARLQRLRLQLEKAAPAHRLREMRERSLRLQERLSRSMDRHLEAEKARLGVAAARLEGASPLRRLSGGYAFVENENGPVRTIQEVRTGEDLKITLRDGAFAARVTGREEEAWKKNAR